MRCYIILYQGSTNLFCLLSNNIIYFGNYLLLWILQQTSLVVYRLRSIDCFYCCHGFVSADVKIACSCFVFLSDERSTQRVKVQRTVEYKIIYLSDWRIYNNWDLCLNVVLFVIHSQQVVLYSTRINNFRAFFLLFRQEYNWINNKQKTYNFPLYELIAFSYQCI